MHGNVDGRDGWGEAEKNWLEPLNRFEPVGLAPIRLAQNRCVAYSLDDFRMTPLDGSSINFGASL
jgi:hypothetical protein